jgi:hypothetical protein
MSRREWKPGDLAMVRLDPQTEIRVFWNGQHWQGVKGVFYDLHVTARPLVVIDPEDAEAVDRLCAYFLMGNEGTAIGNVADLQAALREFANPTPRIEEPTDPAVRVWANGSEWAKCGSWWVTPAANEAPREWDYLVEAVGFEVLS